jgi:hypothetical protein
MTAVGASDVLGSAGGAADTEAERAAAAAAAAAAGCDSAAARVELTRQTHCREAKSKGQRRRPSLLRCFRSTGVDMNTLR